MRPPSLGAVAALVAVVLSAIVAVSVLGGGQVSMILSTVGSSVSGAVDTPAAGDEGDGIVATIGDLPDDARIVRTGSLQLQVTDLDAAVAAARDAVARLGGYISASSQHNAADDSTATVTYRIPAERWEDGLVGLRSAGVTVLAEETEAVEVTDQLVDLEAGIANLRAGETALQAIAAAATRIQDVLSVQERLSEVRGEIERLDARRVRLEDQAAYATITVTFGLQVAAVAEAARGWDPVSEVDRATGSLIDVLQALATAAIWFGIVWLPILLAAGVVVGIGAFVVRRVGAMRGEAPAQPV